MKIYLADTIQRQHLGYNKRFPILHHLESFYAILKTNKLHLFKTVVEEHHNESAEKRTVRDPKKY